MKQYYDGDPSMTCPTGCKGNCPLDCYIEIHQALISDSGDKVDFKTPYKRDGEMHCCGKRMEPLSDKLYCTVCGNER